METLSALLALCAGNSPVTGEFPAQRPVTQSFDVFIDLRPNKRLGKQSWDWWFEAPWRSLWRPCNAKELMDFKIPRIKSQSFWVSVIFWYEIFALRYSMVKFSPNIFWNRIYGRKCQIFDKFDIIWYAKSTNLLTWYFKIDQLRCLMAFIRKCLLLALLSIVIT